MQVYLADFTRKARRPVVVTIVLLALCGVTLMLARATTAGAPTGGLAYNATAADTPTPVCCNGVSGNIISYCDGSAYRYTYELTNSCPITVTGNGVLAFEVSPNSTGPWTSPIHLDYADYRVPPGYSVRSGSLWSGQLPSGNYWFRYQFSLAGSCWTLGLTSQAQPACVGGTVTPGTATRTPTRTPTSTPTASPTPTGCQLRFIDVTQESTFYESILCLACQGIVSGYADGTFRPHSEVTR